MPEALFMPYRHADAALELKPVGIQLDDTAIDIEKVVDHESKTINLAAIDDWAVAKIAIEVSDPNEQLDGVIADGEKISDAIHLHVLTRCARARFRSGRRLQHTGDRIWAGELQVKRENVFGSAALATFAIRGKDTSKVNDLASRAGERVADAESWTLYADDKVTMPGGAIDNEWRHFAEDPDPELKSRSDCAWFLDLRNSDRPKLFLNEGIPGLRPALEVEQRIGKAARVRDVLAHSILQPVLVQLTTLILKDADGTELEELEPAHRKLLLHLAGYIDDETKEAVAQRWITDFRGDTGTVFQDLGTATQRTLKMGRGAEQLVNALEVSNHDNAE